MTKALAKVHKKVHKKKKGNLTSLHEHSRDAKRLRRAGAREDKLEKLKSAREGLNQLYVSRVAFFKEAAQEHAGVFDGEETHGLIQRYLSRHDEELAEIQAQRRPGRPPNSKEDVLKRRMGVEDKEYDVGFWVPDMQDGKNLERLAEWNEEWPSLGTMRFVRVARSGRTAPSTFPPNGES